MSSDNREAPSAQAAPKLRKQPYEPLTNLLLVVPVFLVYHLGLLFVGGLRNGVDLVSGVFFRLLEHSTLAYIGVTLAFVAGLGLAGWYMRATGKIRPVALLPWLRRASCSPS